MSDEEIRRLHDKILSLSQELELEKKKSEAQSGFKEESEKLRAMLEKVLPVVREASVQSIRNTGDEKARERAREILPELVKVIGGEG